MEDISFVHENEKFNYRVAFLIRKNNEVLLEKNINNDFYSLLGGRVKFGETSKKAAIRELSEEIGITIKNNQITLNSISESFFEFSSKKYHEMLFVYDVVLEDDCQLKKMICLDNENVEFFWVGINEIENYNFKPIKLKNFLNKEKFHYIIKNNVEVED